MPHHLTDTQTFWLEHLFRAYSLGLSLSVYAEQQQLDFTDLMQWRQRLIIQHIELPPQHHPNLQLDREGQRARTLLVHGQGAEPAATTDEQLDRLLPWRQEGVVTA